MRLLKAGNSICLLLLFSSFFAQANNRDDDKKSVSQEELAIISALDSLTGKFFESRYRLNLLAEIDSTPIPPESLPRYTEAELMKKILSLPSAMPLAFNDRVRRYVEVYSIDKRAKSEIILGLTEIYFPIFEEALDRRNMPHELRFLPIVESALNPNAVSKAGATGLWQIMYSTGRMLGLEINSYVDERRDPYKSTEAALDYLEKMYGIYGDWLLVIAAYNCGPGNVNKAIARSGGKRSYWEIYPYLPAETRGYVPAFLGAMCVFTYYDDFALRAIKPAYVEHPADTVHVMRKIGLSHIAEKLNMPADELAYLNPSLKKRVVPASVKGYALKLPVSKIGQFETLKDSIYATMPDPEKELLEKSKVSTQYNKLEPSSGSMSKLYYTVKSGDNLGLISGWYNCSVQDIRNWNGIYNNTIRVGQKLLIYVPKASYYNYTDVNSMSFQEKQDWKASGRVKTTIPTGHDDSCNCVYYEVRPGDTLWDISKKYRVSVEDIKKENKISDNGIKPGMVLKIVLI